MTTMIGTLIGIIGTSITGVFTRWRNKINGVNHQQINDQKRAVNPIEKIDSILLEIQNEVIEIENQIASQITPQNLADYFAENLPELFYNRNIEKLNELEILTSQYFPDLDKLIKDFCEQIRSLPLVMNAIILSNIEGVNNNDVNLDKKTQKAKEYYVSELRNIHQKVINIKNCIKKETKNLEISSNNLKS